MDKKKLMLLLGALVVALGTALAARSLFIGASAPKASATQQQAVPKGPKVLVAQRALPVGTIITADSIAFQDWPKNLVQDAYFLDGEADMSKLLGTVVRFPITAGSPVTQGSLVAPGDRGFLAAALGPGMRAVTITVSQKTGVAGFVFPGDHIDLVLTQQVKSTDGSAGELKTAETILRNLRVLATDQSTETESENGHSVVKTARTVTLEVTPRIAEKIAVADTIGTLSLSLRSIADNQSELEKAIASGAVKVPEGASKDEEDKLLNQAMNRPIEGATSYVTGGDVSRFQRRTLPIAPKMRPFGPMPAMPGMDTAGMPNGLSPRASEYVGPVVRVTRGKTTTTVPVGGK
jgi:pilus assembly protein CpaB